MATTTNFGWETPDDTDLVKDGALAMRTLGNAIDASLVDLKGGTTGQVLSKNSNTDMDFTWVTSDDANAIQNDIVDAKGDLITATAADTPARLAVGSNGDTLVADSAATTGLRWQGNYAAGKNKIINGDFNIWQRGTSFSSPASFTYTSDRWRLERDGTATFTISRQTFAPGSAPVAGYESSYFYRLALTTATSGTYVNPVQAIESVRTLAGQTATLSFWAKADTNRSVTVGGGQFFGNSGSPSSFVPISFGIANVTSSWQRFSFTTTIPSISGKTLGNDGADSLNISITPPFTSGVTLDIWGVQLEAGSVATAFQTATGTLQGEFDACLRYYYRKGSNASNAYAYIAQGVAISTTDIRALVELPVPMRVAPTLTRSGNYKTSDVGAAITGGSIDQSSFSGGNCVAQGISFTVASGLTNKQAYYIFADNQTTAYYEWSAEL